MNAKTLARMIADYEAHVATSRDRWSAVEHAFMNGDAVDPIEADSAARQYDAARDDLNRLYALRDTASTR